MSTCNLSKDELDKLARVQHAYLAVSKSVASILHVLALADAANPATQRGVPSARIVHLAGAAKPEQQAHA
jgi:hypothetical protein